MNIFAFISSLESCSSEPIDPLQNRPTAKMALQTIMHGEETSGGDEDTVNSKNDDRGSVGGMPGDNVGGGVDVASGGDRGLIASDQTEAGKDAEQTHKEDEGKVREEARKTRKKSYSTERSNGKSDEEPEAPTLSLGERVAWIRSKGPEFGTVRWIGRIPKISASWTVGVEFVSINYNYT